MIDIEHPFDPALKPFFSEAALSTAEAAAQDGRTVFHTLIHISENPHAYPAVYAFIQQQLAFVSNKKTGTCSTPYQPDSIEFELETIQPDPPAAIPDGLWMADCLWQLSPIILTEPVWLQSVSQAATCHEPWAVRLMALYLRLTDRNRLRKGFNALLLSSGYDLPDLSSRIFSENEGIGQPIFDLAALQLALGCFPRVFFPEILGFTVAFSRLQWPWTEIGINRLHVDLSEFLNLRTKLQVTTFQCMLPLIDDYLSLYPEQTDRLWQRIDTGYRIYRLLAERCFRSINHRLENPPSARQNWLHVLGRKASAATGHHAKVRLAGRSLDDWFSDSPFDGNAFLTALLQSPYINPEHPADSPLLALFDFGGPMFGVLNLSERAVLEKWLINSSTLPHSETLNEETLAPENIRPDLQRPTVPSRIDYSQLDSRHFFYYLVNADLYPDILTFARRRVIRTLKSARRFNRLPFKPYSHQAFTRYINRLYQREVGRYQPLESTPTLSRETYCWGIEQFAPAILVDGCWLQHVDRLQFGPHRAVGDLLFKIYQDECGNGILEQNHPFIYRKLVDSLALKLPPIGSPEFIEHTGFLNSAFDLPVYLMAISKFSSRFLPELLGLNMAIELSGLGNAYLRLSEELSYWGIDPLIVDIHTSIDNVSSGHAFLAQQAIRIYLDEVALGYGSAAVQSHWQRIYDGYCSLQSVCRGFKLALVCHYAIKRLSTIL